MVSPSHQQNTISHSAFPHLKQGKGMDEPGYRECLLLPIDFRILAPRKSPGGGPMSRHVIRAVDQQPIGDRSHAVYAAVCQFFYRTQDFICVLTKNH